MEFKIDFAQNGKTSLRVYRRPSKKAYQKEGVLLHDSMEMHPQYHDMKYYPAFIRVGINHRIDRNYIVRDIPDEQWYIEINTLEDLLELNTEVHHRLIFDHCENGGRIIVDDSGHNYPVFD